MKLPFVLDTPPSAPSGSCTASRSTATSGATSRRDDMATDLPRREGDPARSAANTTEVCPRNARIAAPERQLPDNVLWKIAGHLDRPTWNSFRQGSRDAATMAAEHVKRVEVNRKEDLSRALQTFGSDGLVNLSAVECELNDDDVQALATTSTTSLDLRYNRIGTLGAQHLAANTSIASLDLRHNCIGPVGRAVLEAVRGRFKELHF